jgi:hypothetical protein
MYSNTIGILISLEQKLVESHIRSIAKAITWRAGGTVVTFAIAYIMTRQLELAAKTNGRS